MKYILTTEIEEAEEGNTEYIFKINFSSVFLKK
jgi:hypothetical protein